jgi:hypothetical protein
MIEQEPVLQSAEQAAEPVEQILPPVQEEPPKKTSFDDIVADPNTRLFEPGEEVGYKTGIYMQGRPK